MEYFKININQIIRASPFLSTGGSYATNNFIILISNNQPYDKKHLSDKRRLKFDNKLSFSYCKQVIFFTRLNFLFSKKLWWVNF